MNSSASIQARLRSAHAWFRFEADRFPQLNLVRFEVGTAVVTDYHLGGSDTGLELIDAVRIMIGRRIPVALVTGDTSSAVNKLPQDARLRVASKPVDADELLTLISELLDDSDALQAAAGQ